jgi:hypothetical protein
VQGAPVLGILEPHTSGESEGTSLESLTILGDFQLEFVAPARELAPSREVGRGFRVIFAVPGTNPFNGSRDVPVQQCDVGRRLEDRGDGVPSQVVEYPSLDRPLVVTADRDRVRPACPGDQEDLDSDRRFDLRLDLQSASVLRELASRLRRAAVREHFTRASKCP